MTRAQRSLVALAGGLTVALSLPPWGWWPLAFAGVALFELALGEHPSRRERAALGALFACAWLAPGMAWMWQLTVPGYIVASAVFAAAHGVAAMAAPTGHWSVLGRPLAHTLVEVLRLSWPFGGVPLATLGISQAGGPLLATARIGGVILLTWIVLQTGFAIGTVARRARPPVLRAAAGAIAVIAAAVLLAAIAPRGHGSDELVDIAAVQGGGEQGTRAIDVPSDVVTRRHLDATATIAPDDELDLVVWPENAVDVADFATSEEFAAVAAEAARLDVPFAVGVTEDVPGRPHRFTNAQVVVTPEGDITSRYDKVRRVPFGEYVPLRGMLEALGAPVDQVPNDAVAGTAPGFVELPDGTRAGVVISWEVFFGGRARDGVSAGAAFVLNPTNGASYTGTIVQTQQVASSRLRAVETGRWVVQVSPTGFSAFISPVGDVFDRTAVGEQAVIRHTVELRSGQTWYTRLGDRPWITLVIVAFVATWWLTLRQPGPRPPADSTIDDDRDWAVVHE